jgi:hypothetical protein
VKRQRERIDQELKRRVPSIPKSIPEQKNVAQYYLLTLF